jgi:hypothetical protein
MLALTAEINVLATTVYIIGSGTHTFNASAKTYKYVVVGGGGDPAQTLLGGGDSSYFHYLDVSITDSKLTYRSVGLPTTPE